MISGYIFAIKETHYISRPSTSVWLSGLSRSTLETPKVLEANTAMAPTIAFRLD